MKRKSNILALLDEISKLFGEIKSLYEKSLHAQEISSELKIKVKSFLEHSRSVLDYLAHDIADSIEVEKETIYFPIVETTKNKTSFEGAIGRNLPKLDEHNEELYEYIESIQPYHSGFEWLADFATVTNDTKHQDLTEQTRKENVRIKSEHSSGGAVSWSPSNVRFGNGVFINGAMVNPITQIPESTPETTVTKEIWVDFLFLNKISALRLMEKVKDNLSLIVDNVYKKL